MHINSPRLPGANEDRPHSHSPLGRGGKEIVTLETNATECHRMLQNATCRTDLCYLLHLYDLYVQPARALQFASSFCDIGSYWILVKIVKSDATCRLHPPHFDQTSHYSGVQISQPWGPSLQRLGA